VKPFSYISFRPISAGGKYFKTVCCLGRDLLQFGIVLLFSPRESTSSQDHQISSHFFRIFPSQSISPYAKTPANPCSPGKSAPLRLFPSWFAEGAGVYDLHDSDASGGAAGSKLCNPGREVL
jgi:hypothetical protein